jgi:anti-sigma B factor antagonist
MPSRAAIPNPPEVVEFDLGRSLPDEQTCVVVVEGGLDLAGAPRLKWMLLEAFEAGCSQLVVDLSRATLVDATAVGALVGVKNSIHADTRLAIACSQPRLLRVFQISGMDRTFAIFATVDAALAHVRKQVAHAG